MFGSSYMMDDDGLKQRWKKSGFIPTGRERFAVEKFVGEESAYSQPEIEKLR